MNSKFLLGLGAAALLAACAGVPKETFDGQSTASRADEHPIVVTQTGDRLDVAVKPADQTLSELARQDVARFAGSYARLGHGPMILSTPSGGANADAAALLAHETRMRLAENGVPYAAIAGSTYDASGAEDAPIVLSFTRYEAEAPACAPIYQQDLAHQSNNQAYASFGCSVQANLAAMIEDPHDLLAPREETARDSGRRDTVMDHYRAGMPTGAERSVTESITVSTVAAH
ncbi:MAG: CpaD family pilus assembly protein [Hyphomonadaceae bacterium]